MPFNFQKISLFFNARLCSSSTVHVVFCMADYERERSFAFESWEMTYTLRFLIIFSVVYYFANSYNAFENSNFQNDPCATQILYPSKYSLTSSKKANPRSSSIDSFYSTGVKVYACATQLWSFTLLSTNGITFPNVHDWLKQI